MVLVVPVRVLRGGLRKKDGAHLSGDGGDLLIIWLERPMDAGALQEWRAVDDSGSSQADVRFFLFPFRLRKVVLKRRRKGRGEGELGEGFHLLLVFSTFPCPVSGSGFGSFCKTWVALNALF